MRRILIGGAALTIACLATARPKREPAVFIFLGVNEKQHVAMLRPMISPDIGVEIQSAMHDLKPGTALRCKAVDRRHQAIVEGETATITNLVLDCGGEKFVVTGIDFDPGAK